MKSDDLISRSALMERLQGVFDMVKEEPNQTYAKAIRQAMRDVKLAPAVDAEPVRHGRWKYYSPTMMECSICKRHTSRHKFKYRPNCGAKMDAEAEG